MTAPDPVPPLTVDFQLKLTLKGHTAGVSAVRWSPDGSRLASCSGDGTARIWDAGTGACLAVLGAGHHAGGLNDVAWSPDGGHVATAGDDATARVWSVEGAVAAAAAAGGEPATPPSPVKVLRGHTSYVFAVAFNPRKSELITGSFDETVRIWDTRSGAMLHCLPAHSDPVTGVAYSADGTRAASSSFDGLVRVWDAERGRCAATLLTLASTPPPAGSAAFARTGRLVLSASLDGRVRLWDASAGRAVKVYKGHANDRHCLQPALVVYRPPAPPGGGGGGGGGGGASLLTGGSGGTTAIAGGPPAAGAPPRRLRYAVACGSECGGLWVWDSQSRAVLQVVPGRAPPPPGGGGGGGGEEVKEEGASTQPPHDPPPGPGHTGPVMCVSCHPRKPVLATAGGAGDGTVKVWVDGKGGG